MRGLRRAGTLASQAWRAVRAELHRHGVRGFVQRWPRYVTGLSRHLRMLSQPPEVVSAHEALQEAVAPLQPVSVPHAGGRPLRIALVVHQFLPEHAGGTERVTLSLAQALQSAGHAVELLTTVDDVARFGGAPHPRWPRWCLGVHEGVPVTRVPRSSLPLQALTRLVVHAPSLPDVRQWLNEGAFDVVHVLHPMRQATVIAAARQAGLPVVLTLTDFHLACRRHFLVDGQGRACPGPDEGRECARRCVAPDWGLEASLERHRSALALLQAAAVRVVPSAFMAKRLAEAFPGLEFEVQAHGVDLARSPTDGDKVTAASAPGAAPRWVYVGQITPAKGLDLLLQALALLPGRPVQLDVAGDFDDDPVHEQQIHRLVRADARVRLLGRLDRPSLAALLASADLLCLPSRVPESYSMALHEAAALGVPSLVADRGASAIAVRQQGGGGVVHGDTPQDWARALAAWLDDPALQARWRQAVRPPPSVAEEAQRYLQWYRASVQAMQARQAAQAQRPASG